MKRTFKVYNLKQKRQLRLRSRDDEAGLSAVTCEDTWLSLEAWVDIAT